MKKDVTKEEIKTVSEILDISESFIEYLIEFRDEIDDGFDRFNEVTLYIP